jgi:hypothetical protein
MALAITAAGPRSKAESGESESESKRRAAREAGRRRRRKRKPRRPPRRARWGARCPVAGGSTAQLAAAVAAAGARCQLLAAALYLLCLIYRAPAPQNPPRARSRSGSTAAPFTTHCNRTSSQAKSKGKAGRSPAASKAQSPTSKQAQGREEEKRRGSGT